MKHILDKYTVYYYILTCVYSILKYNIIGTVARKNLYRRYQALDEDATSTAPISNAMRSLTCIFNAVHSINLV